jgi:hypothetical protein
MSLTNLIITTAVHITTYYVSSGNNGGSKYSMEIDPTSSQTKSAPLVSRKPVVNG